MSQFSALFLFFKKSSVINKFQVKLAWSIKCWRTELSFLWTEQFYGFSCIISVSTSYVTNTLGLFLTWSEQRRWIQYWNIDYFQILIKSLKKFIFPELESFPYFSMLSKSVGTLEKQMWLFSAGHEALRTALKYFFILCKYWFEIPCRPIALKGIKRV